MQSGHIWNSFLSSQLQFPGKVKNTHNKYINSNTNRTINKYICINVYIYRPNIYTYVYIWIYTDKEFQMTHHTSFLWVFHLSQQDVPLIQVLKQHLSPGLTSQWGNLHGTCRSISIFLTTRVFCKKESRQALRTELKDRFAAQEIQGGKKMTRWQVNAHLERQSKYGCRIIFWCPVEVNFL